MRTNRDCVACVRLSASANSMFICICRFVCPSPRKRLSQCVPSPTVGGFFFLVCFTVQVIAAEGRLEVSLRAPKMKATREQLAALRPLAELEIGQELQGTALTKSAEITPVS